MQIHLALNTLNILVKHVYEEKINTCKYSLNDLLAVRNKPVFNAIPVSQLWFENLSIIYI